MPDRSTIESLLREEADRPAPGQPEVDFAGKLDRRIVSLTRRRRRYVALAAAAAVAVVAGGISAAVGLSPGSGDSHSAALKNPPASAVPRSGRTSGAPKPSNLTILNVSAPVQVRAGSRATVQITVRTHLGVPVVTEISWGDGTKVHRSTVMRCPLITGGATETLSFSHRWTRAGHYTVTATASSACNSWRGHPNKATASHRVEVVPATTNGIVTAVHVPPARAGRTVVVAVTIRTRVGPPRINSWDFGDGTGSVQSEVDCAGPDRAPGTTQVERRPHAWRTPGTYVIAVSVQGTCVPGDDGSPATVTVHVR